MGDRETALESLSDRNMVLFLDSFTVVKNLRFHTVQLSDNTMDQTVSPIQTGLF